jgi:hypothetical protein
MDAHVEWKVSDDVEGLVAACVECKSLLTQAASQKYRRPAQLNSCDVYAGDKLLELLQLSEKWTPCTELTEEDLVTPLRRRALKTTYLVADFGEFKLHRMSVMGTAAIRVIATFTVTNDDVADLLWYGNVNVL